MTKRLQRPGQIIPLLHILGGLVGTSISMVNRSDEKLDRAQREKEKSKMITWKCPDRLTFSHTKP